MTKILVMLVGLLPPQAPSVPQDTILFETMAGVKEQVVLPFPPVYLPLPVEPPPIQQHFPRVVEGRVGVAPVLGNLGTGAIHYYPTIRQVYTPVRCVGFR